MEGHFPLTISKTLFRHFLTAIEDIYHQGVAHRDIKLANILVDNKFGIKLADFGHSCFTQLDTYLPRGLFGTPKCKAPEVEAKDHKGLPADIYSATIALYNMSFLNIHGPDHILSKKGKNLGPLWAQCAQTTGQEVPESLKILLISIFRKDPEERPTIQQIK